MPVVPILRTILLVVWIAPFLSCGQDQSQTLKIATAANMQFAMEQLIEVFSDESGLDCEMILSSSGKLTAQIEAGAPYNLFVSADIKYPSRLFAEGHCSEPPEIYASGRLVLWTMGDPPPTLERLLKPEVEHIAMANPATAPYGQAAESALRRAGILEVVKDKIVIGESIAQTNQFIISKAADVGFTAKSVVLSPQMEGKGSWVEIPELEIAQGVVLIQETPAAQQFRKFLFSPTAQKILKECGYSIPE